jgi:hypothetical protein
MKQTDEEQLISIAREVLGVDEFRGGKGKTHEEQLTSLAREVVRVLRKRFAVSDWSGWENGNGVEVGSDVERLIRRAERITKRAAKRSTSL